MKISLIYVVLGIAVGQQVAPDDDRPFLRILSPKFICSDKSSNQTTSSNNITIGLQTREGQKLRYKVSVDFEMLDGFKSQKHTLSIWKNIQMLHKKFANMSDEISLKNQINIDARELTPQVIYTFKIVGLDDGNRSSETQNFTITYKGGELKAQQPDLGDGVSLLLLGTEFIYDDMELLAVAEVSFCDPINEFSYRWMIEGLNELGIITGSSLRLPMDSLVAGQAFNVVVSVLNGDGKSMATSTLPMKVLSKEFQVQVTPFECLVGTNREIPFQALLSRRPNAEIDSVKWTCSSQAADCSQSFINATLTQMASFQSAGSYELKTEVAIRENAKSSSARVGVDANVIPHVQIKFFPAQPVNVMQSNEFVMTILNLIPKCMAQWNIQTSEGFADFRSGAEGNLTNIGAVLVKDFEEQFLQELVDYDNNTVSKDIALSIPRGVLLGNEKYKFRLTISCPEPVTDAAPSQSGSVTSYYDIVFETNAPPEVFPLDVTPLNGVAMNHKFKFSTGAAKDLPSDFPLKYSFGYVVDGIEIVIGTFYEHTVAHTQLPFADEIETFCEVCDNNGACEKVLGPKVAANLPRKYTNEEKEFKLGEFGATLRRAEYSKALNSAVVFIKTMKKTNGAVSSFEPTMFANMKLELERLQSSESFGFVNQQKVVEFVKLSKQLMSIMTLSDESFVNDLLALTEKISRASDRVKRETSNGRVMNHDITYIKNVLELSEVLLKSDNTATAQNEKGNYVNHVRRFVVSMCQDKSSNSQRIESKFSVFEVSKVFSPQLSAEVQKMPGADEATILFSANSNFAARYVCLARIRYAIDMFTDKKSELPVFETIILTVDGNGIANAVPVIEVAEAIIAEIPVAQLATDSTCMIMIRKDEVWSFDECLRQKSNGTNRLTCKCKTSGIESIVIKAGKMSSAPTVSSKITNEVKTEKTSSNQTALKRDEIVTKAANPTSLGPINFPAEGNQPINFPSTPANTKQPTEAQPSSPATVHDPVTIKPATQPPKPVDPVTKPTTQPPKPADPATQPATQSPKKETPASAPTKASPPAADSPAKPPATAATKTPEVPPTAKVTPTLIISSKGNSSFAGGGQTNDAHVSWTLIILLLVFFLTIIVLFLAHRCRSFADSHTNLPMRNPSNGIKYARYHDEFTMRG